MAWMRLEVSYIDHPKFLVLSDGAFRLWHEGKSYCEKHLTDGLIPVAAVNSFRHFNQRRAAELSTAPKGYDWPLWEPHDIGVKMHDYLDHNDCREVAKSRIQKSNEERSQNRRLKSIGRDRVLVELIRERDGNHCRYCGRLVSWTDRKGAAAGTYDHINPGGADSLQNVVVCCRGCNSRKGHRSLDEIAALGMALRPAPDQAGIKPQSSPRGLIITPPTATSSSSSPSTSQSPKEQETKEQDARVPRAHQGTALEGALPRNTMSHFWTGNHAYVPAAVHRKFRAEVLPRFGQNAGKADDALEAWYRDVDHGLPEGFVQGDAFKFWQPRFDARWATPLAPATPGTGSKRVAGLMAGGDAFLNRRNP